MDRVAESAATSEKKRQCNCKHSQCLKLYCTRPYDTFHAARNATCHLHATASTERLKLYSTLPRMLKASARYTPGTPSTIDAKCGRRQLLLRS